MSLAPQSLTPEAELATLRELVARHLPAFDVLGSQVTETAGQVEHGVIAVCANFESMATRAQSSVTQAGEFLSGNAGDHSFESVLNRAHATIENLLSLAERAGRVSTQAIERMRRIESATGQISLALAQLDDMALGNKLLAVNARIQAVNAGEKGAGFAAVANEISAQAQRTTSVVDVIRNVTSDLRGVSTEAVSDLERMAETERQATVRSRVEVDGALSEFRNMHQATHSFVDGMRKDAASVASDIASAVRLLQFQDRVNQRLSHVVEDLTFIRQQLEPHIAGVEVDSSHVLRQFEQHYTMSEERNVLGATEVVHAGEVELF